MGARRDGVVHVGGDVVLCMHVMIRGDVGSGKWGGV